MSHFAISTSKEPVRLFKSDFLEFFTHIHPAVIVVIWLPAAPHIFYGSTPLSRSKQQVPGCTHPSVS